MTRSERAYIHARLSSLQCPCLLTVYGPESLDNGWCARFGQTNVDSIDHAARYIVSLKYEGPLDQMTITGVQPDCTVKGGLMVRRAL